MILRRTSRYETRRNTHFYKHALTCVCANFGKYLNSLHDSPLNVASWSQHTSDHLWASFWPSLDHEHFQASCDKFQFSKTPALIQPVQPQVLALVESNSAHNMQVTQGWQTFRWLRFTLLSFPAATLIRLQIDEFSDSTLCVGISNPDPSNNWATKLYDAWTAYSIRRRNDRSIIHLHQTHQKA